MSRRDKGILVVNRLAMLRRFSRPGGIQTRVPSVSLTHEDIFRRYRGFDGQPWPERDHPEFDVENGLAALSSMAAVRQYVDRIDPRRECDVILVDSTMPTDSVPLDVAPRFLGFDVGMFNSEWSCFSSLFNEVLFGSEPEMRAFADRLNDSLLLSTHDDARELHVLRERLLAREGNLEDCEVFHTHAIHAPEVRRGGSPTAR